MSLGALRAGGPVERKDWNSASLSAPTRGVMMASAAGVQSCAHLKSQLSYPGCRRQAQAYLFRISSLSRSSLRRRSLFRLLGLGFLLGLLALLLLRTLNVLQAHHLSIKSHLVDEKIGEPVQAKLEERSAESCSYSETVCTREKDSESTAEPTCAL